MDTDEILLESVGLFWRWPLWSIEVYVIYLRKRTRRWKQPPHLIRFDCIKYTYKWTRKPKKMFFPLCLFHHWCWTSKNTHFVYFTHVAMLKASLGAVRATLNPFIGSFQSSTDPSTHPSIQNIYSVCVIQIPNSYWIFAHTLCFCQIRVDTRRSRSDFAL